MSVPPFVPMTRQDIADLLGISLRTVDNLVSSGTMPAPARLGGRVYWHPGIFYAWLDVALRKTPESVGGDTSIETAIADENEVMEASADASAEGVRKRSRCGADVGQANLPSKGPKGTAVERMKARQAQKIRVTSSKVSHEVHPPV